MRFSLNRLWVDSDGMLEVEVFLEVASLNSLGKLIDNWAVANDVALVFEGNDG